MSEKMVLILDFGGQYSQLIARRVRDCGVYCEVHSYRMSAEEIRKIMPLGIILSGGPNSVYEEDAPRPDSEIFNLDIPTFGICYGMQIMAHLLGGDVKLADNKEYGATKVHYDNSSPLFSGMHKEATVSMSHTDFVSEMPEGFRITASSDECPVAAMENSERKLYGIQFHAESDHSENGREIICNFLHRVCGADDDWSMHNYSEQAVTEIREKVGDGRVLLGLSGGVDSSVCAKLLETAVGKQLICVFVDTGLMRKNESDEVEEIFGRGDSRFIRIDAEERFLSKLTGVTDPERKRKIIGEEFIRVFEEEASKIGEVDFLAQGTIYPDVIESGEGHSAVIKSHHNVGGLPDVINFKEIIEPLRYLFKDEVRELGRELGLPKAIVKRQPFPGPGLAVRVIGEITKDKLEVLREADAIFREELEKAGLDNGIGQYFAVLTDMRSVGVMGDARTYDYTLALRAVKTTDFMTAEWERIPYDVLETVSRRIVNEADHINRIVYDITSKPPATIEWE